MKSFFCLSFTCFCAAAVVNLSAQENETGLPSGEEAIAVRYAEWAESAFREKRFPQAEVFLLRAADYASVSSDLSYLLALVKKELSSPVREVLTAARLALATDRWTLYSRRDALYTEAAALIHMRRYNEALNTLSELDGDERAAELRLLALEHLPGAENFYAALTAAFERYPYNPLFPSILFRSVSGRMIPSAGMERVLVDTALKRLPALLELDADLIRHAAPFMADRDEARRLLGAWRETGGAGLVARLAALPVCLETGLIGDEEAIDELFPAPATQGVSGETLPVLDRGTLLAVWGLLRTGEAREEFRGRLLSFSGAITGDDNRDGVVNSRAGYRNGSLVSYTMDADQDGVNEILAAFEDGWPVSGELAYTDDTETDRIDKVFIVWEKYPALHEAARGKTRYFFRPMEFNYPVVRFETLGGPGGIPFPEPEAGAAMFTGRLAFANAYRIERPGNDFPGSVERIECEGGIVYSAKEYLDGRLVAETGFEKGLPVFQRIDLDLDGRMETVRRFRRTADSFFRLPNDGDIGILQPEIEVIESDWDGDGFVEYREEQ
ncbi:MAG: hypothetical protein LBD44_05750 [Spirochaetaceae bacterium]|jgi:tetratricopeptide (TPR) repeat protein|nr:hypothetical protein [Spirochaetaceae bacterium]